LLTNNMLGSLVAGILLASILIFCVRKKEAKYQFYALLNVINFFNPRAWIMGLVWYIPLFLYLYPRARTTRERLFILLPLWMPPFTNLNGFLAYGVALMFAIVPSARARLESDRNYTSL